MSTSPIPPVLDQDRYAVYQPTAATTDFALGFPLFGEAADVAVYLDGEPLALTTDYTVRSTANGASLTPAPVSDAYIRLKSPINSGKLEIFGNFRPRRTIQATAPYGTRDFNFAFSLLMAALREVWLKLTRALKVPVGEPELTIPPREERAGQVFAFDIAGKPTIAGRYADLMSSASAAVLAAQSADQSAATTSAAAGVAVAAAMRAEVAAGAVESPVSYAVEQHLTAAQQALALKNLGLEGLQNALTPFGFTADAGQTEFPLGMSPSANACIVSMNGAWLVGGGVDYAISGSTLTMMVPAVAGDRIAGVAIASFEVANALLPAANLADLADIILARNNLGLKSAATLAAGDPSLMPSGSVIGRAYAESNASTSITATILVDTSAPQITEGGQVVAVNYTPKLADSKLRIRFKAIVVNTSASTWAVVSSFLDVGPDAVEASAVYTGVANAGYEISLESEVGHAGAVAQAISVRAACTSGALQVNGAAAGNLGGTRKATLIVEEIAP